MIGLRRVAQALPARQRLLLVQRDQLAQLYAVSLFGEEGNGVESVGQWRCACQQLG